MHRTEQTFAEVIGKNVKNIRQEKNLTMEQLATAGKAIGMSWSAGSIGSIENGSFKPTIETILALAYVLNNVDYLAWKTGTEWEFDPVQLDQLLEGASTLAVTEKKVVTKEELSRWLSGTSRFRLHTSASEKDRLKNNMSKFLEPEVQTTSGEQRIAKKAGISPALLRTTAEQLWGKRFEDYRDEIAGAEATPQKKGRVTRDLIGEINTYLENHRGER